MQAIRGLVYPFVAEMLPSREQARERARKRLAQLENESTKLMQAHYADALALLDLKREQGRIAIERAACEQTLAEQEVAADGLYQRLSDTLLLLTHAQQRYLDAEDLTRRDLNQGVFAHIYINDDEVVGSDLTPAFRRLLSDDLEADRASERKQHLKQLGRTSDHLRLTEVADSADRGRLSIVRDLPPRAVRTRPEGRLTAFLERERPHGTLPWERNDPENVSRGRERVGSLRIASLVGGSTEPLLVGAEGIEPPTTSL